MNTSTPDLAVSTRDCGCAPDCCAPSGERAAAPAPSVPSVSSAGTATAPAAATADQIREFVRERYGAIADRADSRESDAGCGCGPSCCAPENSDGASANYDSALGYSAVDAAAVPAGANLGLGCGNPLALASIRPGETVLDLGSGAGFDCFLAARQLAGAGRVIGVDMTPAMISKARANARRSGHANVEFRLGEIEALPVADSTVDLILSNCVVNLSPEKPRVLREAFRVLKPGGRLAIADIVATRELPSALRDELAAIGACVAGAAHIDELRAMLVDAGFTGIEIAPKETSRAFIDEWTPGKNAGQFVVSATIAAYKPAR